MLNIDNIKNIREINESRIGDDYKQDAQILNMLISFKKEHYHTVKYRLSNLINLEKQKEEHLKPLNEFINKEINR